MKKVSVFALFLLPLFVSTAWAESSKRSEVLNDPALPAVIPGEEVKTTTGKKIKVWSTGGEVSKSQIVEPPQPGGSKLPHGDSFSVIVDQRDDKVKPRDAGSRQEGAVVKEY